MDRRWSDPNNGLFRLPLINLDPNDIPYAVELGDMDNDEDNDIVVSIPSAAKVLIIPNNGDGTFGTPVTKVMSVATLCDPMPLAVADFDAANGADFVSVGRYTDNGTLRPVIEVFSRQPGSGFNFTTEVFYPNPTIMVRPSGIAASRFLPTTEYPPPLDILICDRAGKALFVLNRTTSGWSSTLNDQGAIASNEVAAALLNSSGAVRQLICAQAGPPETGTNDAKIVANGGPGISFGVVSPALQTEDVNLTDAYSIGVGTLNSDLARDVVVALRKDSFKNPPPTPPTITTRGGLALFLGDGCGDFEGDGPFSPVPYRFDVDIDPNALPGPWFVRVADLNRDQRDDLIVTCYGTHKLSVIVNNLPAHPPG